ncbi:MAG: CbtA family protein [Bauldia sp.]
MVGSLLVRGMLVGVLAGLLAFGFARVFGEPQVDRAIAFEELTSQAGGEAAEDVSGHSHSAGHSHGAGDVAEAEPVGRTTQAGLGLLTGVLVYGASIGGLFALVFGFTYVRVGRLGPRATAALLALAGFIVIVVVPALKYPANPPAIGNPDTIGTRTGLFFLMLAISIAAALLAVSAARRWWQRQGAWNAALLGVLVFVVVVGVAQAALPTVNEVPGDFSADLLWRFRLAALGMQGVLWTTIGLGFGVLVERDFAGRLGGRPSTRSAT